MKRNEIKKIFDEHLNSLDCLNTPIEVAMYLRLLDAAQELVKNCSIPDVVGQSEQLVSFLRQYQKACEIMHVNKIDAKNFVEQYKTN